MAPIKAATPTCLIEVTCPRSSPPMFLAVLKFQLLPIILPALAPRWAPASTTTVPLTSTSEIPSVEAVGGDQGAVPPYHLLHVGLSHVEEHNGDPPVLLQEQVHHAVRGVYPPRLAYLSDVIALQGRSVVVHTHY